MSRDPVLLTCATWNIHRGRGNDGVVAPRRTEDVLLAEVGRPGLDMLVLTEADEETPPHAGVLDLDRIAADTGLRTVHTRHDVRWGPHSHGFLGVVILLHPRFEVQDIALVDLPGHCHRGAVVVDLGDAGRKLRLIGTHLSLTQGLRAVQLRTLGQHLLRRESRPTILAGDLNEWRPWGGFALSQLVLGGVYDGPAKATFPTGWPLLPLDRVLVTSPLSVTEVEVMDGPGIRQTSDHRPLVACIAMPAETAAGP